MAQYSGKERLSSEDGEVSFEFEMKKNLVRFIFQLSFFFVKLQLNFSTVD